MNEEEVRGSKLIDSSIWIEYFIEGNFKEIIESKDILNTCILSLFEIKRVFKKNKSLELKKIKENINFIKQKSILINVNESIVEKAVDIAIKNDISAMDSLIYTSALGNDLEFITLDNDFRGLDKAKVLDK